MFDVQKYWQQRYKQGGTSGSGSYGRLAIFKAKILNQFVKNNNIQSVIEFGCGDGNQLSLSDYPLYKGFDISEEAVNICKFKFNHDLSKIFKTEYNGEKCELGISLDVLFHLVDQEDWEKYIRQLFAASTKYVIIYSCNENAIKGKVYGIHYYPRIFTSFIYREFPDFKFERMICNEYPYDESNPDNTSTSNFYIWKRLR